MTVDTIRFTSNLIVSAASLRVRALARTSPRIVVLCFFAIVFLYLKRGKKEHSVALIYAKRGGGEGRK